LDRDGTLLWYRSLVSDYPKITNQVGMAASPILHGDTLIVPMDNAGDSFVAGLDVQTGKNRWKVERGRDINWTTPVVFGKRPRAGVVFQAGKEVSAFDPTTGKPRWSYPTEKGSTIPSPVSDGDVLFAPGGETLALRPGPDGTTPEVLWRSSKLQSGYASPL